MGAAFLISFLVVVLYAAVMLRFGAVFRRIEIDNETGEYKPVSIIVCARNEEAHLHACLRDILSQAYPPEMIQLIVVNDASTDRTLLIADETLEQANIEYRILSNPSRIGKKASISLAMKSAKHSYVVLRDADTESTDPGWLRGMVSLGDSPVFTIGAVVVRGENSKLLSRLQELESLALLSVTAGSAKMGKPFLCSGANLGFSKKLFEDVSGFESHQHILSGDDIFFLEEVKRLKAAKIRFCKSPSSVVFTFPMKTWSALLTQKTRWASKVRHVTNPLNWIVAVLVSGANMAMLFSFAMFLFYPNFWRYALLLTCIKVGADIFVLSVASRFIRAESRPVSTLLTSLVYPFYALIVTVAALLTKPLWKEE